MVSAVILGQEKSISMLLSQTFMETGILQLLSNRVSDKLLGFSPGLDLHQVWIFL